VVTGDGRSTPRQLVLADLRVGRVSHLYLTRLAHRLQEVPRKGERVRLVFVGNHCRGSIFEDGTQLVTQALTDAVERIAGAVPGFHFGRIDVRFASLPALLRGEGFRIIEINGAGSEATRIWDPNTTLSVPHCRSEPQTLPSIVWVACQLSTVAASEAVDGGLSDERLIRPYATLPNPTHSVRNGA
jgi:hypothetical protein